ncbi:nicotinate-nucleotide--dimethylbenzimidazole phosphoribosyltransferase [Bacillus solimangrovi]|uniref:Nicotinate-nucleotide--dimethylbenzimidazole phosphoribosyltransferase n=1 Tax=Bacillus solimangrovi TaxID=1305675 RepID=A0A1E5LJ84_9BACI|nr:nicotinate-nucleotide--dimethylbenzimidazole phosphoribosyltransferase [Bacillus solimangrovi]
MKEFKIDPLDKENGLQVKSYIDTLTKPPGSLGKLEQLAIQLGEITSQQFPSVTPPGVIVFAADHGIAAEGVSAFPQEVTAQMVTNFLNGGAAINVFSKQIGAQFKIVDVGVATEIDGEHLIKEKIRYGTANFLIEDAMTRDEALRAVEVGYEVSEKLIKDGIKCLIVGEMGIGNTTPSSTIVSLVSGRDVESVVGFGTGITQENILHKQQVIKKAIEVRSPNAEDPFDILAKVGGLEIAAMAGAMLAAASNRIPILVDGFICTAAALIAKLINNVVSEYMIIGHRSVEPGHRIAIDLLGKEPLLDLNLRLGEGSGAAIAFPLLLSSTLMISEMSTFTSAKISSE